TLTDDTASLYPSSTIFAYPKPGTTTSAVRIGVVPASGGVPGADARRATPATTWMKTPGDPRNTYLASLEWIDASTVAMQQLNRLQTENDYLLAEASTGSVTRVFHDAVSATAKPAGWVDVQGDITWGDPRPGTRNDNGPGPRDAGGRAFLWLSERDGWRHLYRVTRDGKATLLTDFAADVISLEGVDATSAYFLASPSNATQRYLFRAPL